VKLRIKKDCETCVGFGILSSLIAIFGVGDILINLPLPTEELLIGIIAVVIAGSMGGLLLNGSFEISAVA
jgi:hypothetical protein